MNAGIYIHIPFCRSKCSYCGFNSRPWRDDLVGRYVPAVVREIRHFSELEAATAKVDTIYLGGGTPSILPAEQIATLLHACRRSFEIAGHCEITLEANPGTLTEAKTRAYRDAGINRISLGAQSFHDADLILLGRAHSVAQTVESAGMLRRHGFHNLSLDLMLGLPGQARGGWLSNLEQGTKLEPAHVSVYMLELEPKAPLYQVIAQGGPSLPSEDEVSDWYLETRVRLEERGYEQYEISNFARPGFQCSHNLKYWLRKPVYGFGAGSHSFDGSARYANHPDLETYLQITEEGRSPVEWRRSLSEEEALEETFFLGLRLTKGLNWDDLQTRFPRGLLSECESGLQELTSLSLVKWDGLRVRLTPAGMLLSNEVFQRFVCLRRVSEPAGL